MAVFKTSAVQVLDKNGSIQNFPPGAIVPFFGTSIPSGWLLCNGAQYSTTGTYKDLFDVIGTTYGSGAGTFAVPNMLNTYPASSNNDNVTNYPTTHTHSGNVTTDATATSHIITHTHTGGSPNLDSASASHNHNNSSISTNGGISPGSNANSVANRAVNSGPAANSPQAGWDGHTHNAGTGATYISLADHLHTHNTTTIASAFNASGNAPAHTVSGITYSSSSAGVTLTSLKAYFIIKY